MGFFFNKNTKANDKDTNTKIKMVDITKLKIDREFKAVFNQEHDKVSEISKDMLSHGFDKTRPIITTESFIVVDGHSRLMAAKKAGLTKVPVIIKKFESRDQTIEYEFKMQLNSRRLSDAEYLNAFIQLDEFRRSDPNASGKSDEAIGRQLNNSARSISKIREITKKASPELLEKIKKGSISLNKAYETIKSVESAKKTANNVSSITKNSQTGKGINTESFKLGILYVLNEIEDGKTKAQILKDPRISKLGLSTQKLTTSDLNKITLRFGIN